MELLSLRQEMGLSQEELCNILSLSQASISRIERGIQPPVGKTLKRLEILHDAWDQAKKVARSLALANYQEAVRDLDIH